jgi:hypothetical protein
MRNINSIEITTRVLFMSLAARFRTLTICSDAYEFICSMSLVLNLQISLRKTRLTIRSLRGTSPIDSATWKQFAIQNFKTPVFSSISAASGLLRVEVNTSRLILP